ncbi:hypothetical protein C8R46DRAFT_1037926 [Mycena filopes]|nr:hypothetical protein C8R46DRAFT_1037926 [Mycena filopes]
MRLNFAKGLEGASGGPFPRKEVGVEDKRQSGAGWGLRENPASSSILASAPGDIELGSMGQKKGFHASQVHPNPDSQSCMYLKMVSVGLNNFGCLRTIEPRENNLWYETSWFKIITRAGAGRDGRLATNPGAGMLNRGKRVDVTLQPGHLVRGTQGDSGTACPTSQRTSASKSAVINHAVATMPFIYLRAGVEELSRSSFSFGSGCRAKFSMKVEALAATPSVAKTRVTASWYKLEEAVASPPHGSLFLPRTPSSHSSSLHNGSRGPATSPAPTTSIPAPILRMPRSGLKEKNDQQGEHRIGRDGNDIRRGQSSSKHTHSPRLASRATVIERKPGYGVQRGAERLVRHVYAVDAPPRRLEKQAEGDALGLRRASRGTGYTSPGRSELLVRTGFVSAVGFPLHDQPRATAATTPPRSGDARRTYSTATLAPDEASSGAHASRGRLDIDGVGDGAKQSELTIPLLGVGNKECAGRPVEDLQNVRTTPGFGTGFEGPHRKKTGHIEGGMYERQTLRLFQDLSKNSGSARRLTSKIAFPVIPSQNGFVLAIDGGDCGYDARHTKGGRLEQELEEHRATDLENRIFKGSPQKMGLEQEFGKRKATDLENRIFGDPLRKWVCSRHRGRRSLLRRSGGRGRDAIACDRPVYGEDRKTGRGGGASEGRIPEGTSGEKLKLERPPRSDAGADDALGVGIAQNSKEVSGKVLCEVGRHRMAGFDKELEEKRHVVPPSRINARGSRGRLEETALPAPASQLPDGDDHSLIAHGSTAILTRAACSHGTAHAADGAGVDTSVLGTCALLLSSTSHCWYSVAAVRFGPVQDQDFPNLELNPRSGSAKFPNLEPDPVFHVVTLLTFDYIYNKQVENGTEMAVRGSASKSSPPSSTKSGVSVVRFRFTIGSEPDRGNTTPYPLQYSDRPIFLHLVVVRGCSRLWCAGIPGICVPLGALEGGRRCSRRTDTSPPTGELAVVPVVVIVCRAQLVQRQALRRTRCPGLSLANVDVDAKEEGRSKDTIDSESLNRVKDSKKCTLEKTKKENPASPRSSRVVDEEGLLWPCLV